MKQFYAACNVHGPVSKGILAESVEDAVDQFEAMNAGELIDDCSTDAEDDLDFCGSGMSDDEFSDVMKSKGFVPVHDLSPIHNHHSGTTAHLLNGWILYEEKE